MSVLGEAWAAVATARREALKEALAWAAAHPMPSIAYLYDTDEQREAAKRADVERYINHGMRELGNR